MNLKKINPETNVIVRATLYVIGVGGFFHLATLLILAITKHKAAYFHPFYAIDLDKIWPALPDKPIVYILGWLGFFATIYLVSRLLKGPKKP